jgi:urease accessory protein
VRRTHGRLALRFERDAVTGVTRVDVHERRPPLAVVRGFAHDDGTALVHMHNVSGGVLAGDALETSIEVGTGSRAQVTTVGATQVYRSASGSEARQSFDIRVADGALLEYVPDPLIPFAGAVYSQRTTIALGADAGLFWWEIVAPGRIWRGERFGYERLELCAEISADEHPIALERFVLEPRARPLESAVRLGGYLYFGTFFACRTGVEPSRWSALEARLAEVADEVGRPGVISFGCSTLAAHGLSVRAVAATRRDIAEGFTRFWREARSALYGDEPVQPRKAQ